MKFEYEGGTEDREVVAFIDSDDELWLRSEDDEGILLREHGSLAYVSTYTLPEAMAEHGVKQRFYRGDSIKITF